MVAFGGKLLLAMYGSHSGASRLSAVWRLSAFWRVRYQRFHCNYVEDNIESVVGHDLATYESMCLTAYNDCHILLECTDI